MRAETKQAIKAYKKEIELFKAFCESYPNIDSEAKDQFEELDWYSLSIGYFLALNVPANDAIELALFSRYDKQYWGAE